MAPRVELSVCRVFFVDHLILVVSLYCHLRKKYSYQSHWKCSPNFRVLIRVANKTNPRWQTPDSCSEKVKKKHGQTEYQNYLKLSR